LSDYFSQNSSVCSFRNAESWVVLTPIELSIKQKIEAIGTPLKDWDVQINYGIKTGFNDAFIIDGKKRAELITADPKSAEIIRPILRGRDIKRYHYDFADLWLINTHNGVKDKGVSRINIDDYPAIKMHLDQYWDDIVSRADIGDTPYNLRNCAYMDDFNKQKILWAETMRIKRGSNERFPRFTWTDQNILTDKTCFFAIGNDLKYIVGVLNSIIGRYQCKKMVSILDNGGYLMQKIFIEKIILPNIDISYKCKIEDLVNILLQDTLSKNKQEKYEIELDQAICKLYNLTDDEYQFILTEMKMK
jgi:hypothetical protein